jgi:hypothetical protein
MRPSWKACLSLATSTRAIDTPTDTNSPYALTERRTSWSALSLWLLHLSL